jgi:hypothetical protein
MDGSRRGAPAILPAGLGGSVKQSNSLSPATRRCSFPLTAAPLHAASGRSRCAAADQHTVDLLGALKAVGNGVERGHGKDDKARASFSALGYNFLRRAISRHRK